jgi:hypothetical protein
MSHALLQHSIQFGLMSRCSCHIIPLGLSSKFPTRSCRMTRITQRRRLKSSILILYNFQFTVQIPPTIQIQVIPSVTLTKVPAVLQKQRSSVISNHSNATRSCRIHSGCPKPPTPLTSYAAYSSHSLKSHPRHRATRSCRLIPDSLKQIYAMLFHSSCASLRCCGNTESKALSL